MYNIVKEYLAKKLTSDTVKNKNSCKQHFVNVTGVMGFKFPKSNLWLLITFLFNIKILKLWWRLFSSFLIKHHSAEHTDKQNITAWYSTPRCCITTNDSLILLLSQLKVELWHQNLDNVNTTLHEWARSNNFDMDIILRVKILCQNIVTCIV